MNRYLLAILAAVAAALYAGAQETADTTLFVENPERVIVTETPEALMVHVLDAEGEQQEMFRFPYEEGKTVKGHALNSLPLGSYSVKGVNWDLTIGGLGFGFVNACNAPAGSGLEMGKSLEFSIRNALAVSMQLPGGRNRFMAGVGMVWRNYKMSTDTRFYLDRATGSVSIGGYAEGLVPQASRLKTFSLSFPVSWRHTLGKKQALELSVILNANMYGSLKTTYTTPEGIKSEEFSKVSSQLRKFSVDFSLAVQVCPMISLYVRYSPMKVFKSGSGPEFTPLSTGLLIAY